MDAWCPDGTRANPSRGATMHTVDDNSRLGLLLQLPVPILVPMMWSLLLPRPRRRHRCCCCCCHQLSDWMLLCTCASMKWLTANRNWSRLYMHRYQIVKDMIWCVCLVTCLTFSSVVEYLDCYGCEQISVITSPDNPALSSSALTARANAGQCLRATCRIINRWWSGFRGSGDKVIMSGSLTLFPTSAIWCHVSHSRVFRAPELVW